MELRGFESPLHVWDNERLVNKLFGFSSDELVC